MSKSASSSVITARQYEMMICPPPAVPSQNELFDLQRDFIVRAGLGTSEELEALRVHLPGEGIFLLMPRRPGVPDYNALMQHVVYDGRKGESWLKPEHELTDLVETPTEPYMMLGIGGNSRPHNVFPCDAREAIAEKGLSPFTAFEGAILAAIYPLLPDAIDLVGSKCDPPGYRDLAVHLRVLSGHRVFEGDHGKVVLGVMPERGEFHTWMTPFCKERKVA
jgi:hypothetical protein